VFKTNLAIAIARLKNFKIGTESNFEDQLQEQLGDALGDDF
jgi:hypothetical protein